MNIKELAERAVLKMLLEIGGTDKFLEHFAKLVAAHEREKCAKVCEENVDDNSEGYWDSACINCANHIRARSNT